MSRAIAFFGNRYSPLSRVFYRALRDLAERQNFSIVVVDTSTPAESRAWRRARNSLVSAAKSLLGIRRPTAAIDWFETQVAAEATIITPSGHLLSDADLPVRLRKLKIRAALVAGCDQVLRRPLIEAIPRIVNYHNSLLPDYRGCDAVLWAMLAGETSIGFSFHTIESERVDAGRVLFQGHLGVDYTSAPAEVDGELADAAASRLNELLEIMLGDAWTSQGWTVEGGTYHRRGEILPLQIFDARLTGCELQQRLQIFGTLRMPFSSRLRITSIEPVPRQTSLSQELALAIGDCRTDGRGVMVGCADGPLLIKTIHFLPARLFAFRLGGQLLAAGNSALPPRTAKRKRQTA